MSLLLRYKPKTFDWDKFYDNRQFFESQESSSMEEGSRFHDPLCANTKKPFLMYFEKYFFQNINRRFSDRKGISSTLNFKVVTSPNSSKVSFELNNLFIWLVWATKRALLVFFRASIFWSQIMQCDWLKLVTWDLQHPIAVLCFTLEQ